jgi:hypothetical protein
MSPIAGLRQYTGRAKKPLGRTASSALASGHPPPPLAAKTPSTGPTAAPPLPHPVPPPQTLRSMVPSFRTKQRWTLRASPGRQGGARTVAEVRSGMDDPAATSPPTSRAQRAPGRRASGRRTNAPRAESDRRGVRVGVTSRSALVLHMRAR